MACGILAVIICCCCCITLITCQPPTADASPMFISTLMKCFGKCCTSLTDFGYQWNSNSESVGAVPPIQPILGGNEGRRTCCKRELECIWQECRTTGSNSHPLSFNSSYTLPSPEQINSQFSCIPSMVLLAELLNREKMDQFSALNQWNQWNQWKRIGEERRVQTNNGDTTKGSVGVVPLEELLAVSLELEKVKDGNDMANLKLELELELVREHEHEHNETEKWRELESGVGRGSWLNGTANGCESLFTSLNFWGAHIVIFANITYIIPYIVVVLVYLITPGLRRRAYDRAVIWFNLSQILLNGILIGIGLLLLCHATIQTRLFAPVGLIIMFLTISSTFWLFVICIDMTLVITRFRWAPRSQAVQKQQQQQEEKRKFRIYAICSWTAALLPTVLAAVLELSPLLSESSPFRPNFHRFENAPNLAVILYVATLPALTCFANTLLFFYTTYRIIVMEKSIRSIQLTITTCESTTNLLRKQVKKRYWLFLKLYLLMDAPWITNALAAIFVDLWLLKFLRMIQPILMMFAILPRHTILRMGQIMRGRIKTPRHCPPVLAPSAPASANANTPGPGPGPATIGRTSPPIQIAVLSTTEFTLPPAVHPHPHLV